MNKKLILTALIALIPLACSPIKTSTPAEKPVACTMDVRQCPDGSFVGRSGPNCEFICPSAKSD